MKCSLTVFALVALTAFSATAETKDVGTLAVDTRIRFETAEIGGLQDADNLSARLRLGYTTPEVHRFQATVGGEFTGVADENSYNAAGVYGDSARAVIADPKNVQLDLASVSYRFDSTKVEAGRQVIDLDNQRFVGSVGWRQNRQTYDAVTVRYQGNERLKLFYGYVDNVVRIFGSEAPGTGGNAEEAGSESYLGNISYEFCKGFKLTGYSYMLDLEDVPPTQSVDIYGGRATGTVELDAGASVGYLAELATQEDAGANPLDYNADYLHLNANATWQGVMSEVGYEVLGSDNTGAVDDNGAPVFASFQTPLATGHAFNGFADRFLTTPANGLEDFYVMLGYKLSLPAALGPLVAKAWYHDFSSDEGSLDLGDEWDAVLVKPIALESIPGTITALAKYASYNAGEVGADTDRFSVEVNYAVTF